MKTGQRGRLDAISRRDSKRLPLQLLAAGSALASALITPTPAAGLVPSTSELACQGVRELFVSPDFDNNCVAGEFNSIQQAVNCAGNADLIRVLPGTYEETVIIFPKPTEDRTFCIRLIAAGEPDRPIVVNGSATPWTQDFEHGVFSIINDPQANPKDYRQFDVQAGQVASSAHELNVEIHGFTIQRRAGEGDALSGIAVINCLVDPRGRYVTGLLASENHIRIEGRKAKGIKVGSQSHAHVLSQSPKWVDLSRNVIHSKFSHGIGTWRAVGQIHHNRVYKSEEGIHVGGGYWRGGGTHHELGLGPDLAFDSMEAAYNFVSCSSFNNLHFAHYTSGRVHHNILFNQRNRLSVDFAGSLVLGHCHQDPRAAPENLPGGLGPSVGCEPIMPGEEIPAIPPPPCEIRASYNTIVGSDGPGIWIKPGVATTTITDNIIAQTGFGQGLYPMMASSDSGGVWPEPGFGGIAATSGIYMDPHASVPGGTKNFNVLWRNGPRDEPVSYSHCGLAGTDDLTDGGTRDYEENDCDGQFQIVSSAESNPQFWNTERSDGPVPYRSFMLRPRDQEEGCENSPGSAPYEGGVDRGTPWFPDQFSPPGAGEVRADAGAFGGIGNTWDPAWLEGGPPSNPCFQFVVDPRDATCRPEVEVP